MKCEHCGKNEATFFYKSNVNGHVTQVHLCQDCAQAMGYTSALRRSMGPTSLFGDDFWSRPFSLLEPFMDSFGSRMLTEFPEPGQPEVLEQPVRQEKSAGLVDKAQQEALRYECKRNSLPWKAKTTRKPPACGTSFAPCPRNREGSRHLNNVTERMCFI